MATFGYGRVSTAEQHPENQRRELEAAGYAFDFWFQDVGVSGKAAAAQRPEFRRLLDRIRAGETLVVAKLDRLGRDAVDVLQTLRGLQEQKVGVIVHQLGKIDLTSPAGRLLLTMLSAVAEMERDLLVERTQAGLARAKAEGKRLGRPAKTTPEQREAIRRRARAGESVSGLAREFRVSRATVIAIRDAAEAAEASAPVREPVPEEPYSYRRPSLDAPGDPRCQATTREGTRCRSATALVVFALDAQGRRAEFGACKRHVAEFWPHRSVLASGKREDL